MHNHMADCLPVQKFISNSKRRVWKQKQRNGTSLCLAKQSISKVQGNGEAVGVFVCDFTKAAKSVI